MFLNSPFLPPPVIASKGMESDYGPVAKTVTKQLSDYNKILMEALQAGQPRLSWETPPPLPSRPVPSRPLPVSDSSHYGSASLSPGHFLWEMRLPLNHLSAPHLEQSGSWASPPHRCDNTMHIYEYSHILYINIQLLETTIHFFHSHICSFVSLSYHIFCTSKSVNTWLLDMHRDSIFIFEYLIE